MTGAPKEDAMADESAGGLSVAMVSALGAMPITLREGALPMFSPSGQTLAALKRRELIELRGDRWCRTLLGERVWAFR